MLTIDLLLTKDMMTAAMEMKCENNMRVNDYYKVERTGAEATFYAPLHN